MSRPLLLIDVDGVLNPFTDDSARLPAGFQEHVAQGIRIRLSVQHGDWLRRLASDYELVWATTWEGDANPMVGARIGLPHLRHIRFTPADAWDSQWTNKLPDVQEFVADRPMAWIDDRFGEAEMGWAERRSNAGIPTLLVQADGRVGLTAEHVEALLVFARGSSTPLD